MGKDWCIWADSCFGPTPGVRGQDMHSGPAAGVSGEDVLWRPQSRYLRTAFESSIRIIPKLAGELPCVFCSVPSSVCSLTMKCRSPLSVTPECLPLDVCGPQPQCVWREAELTPLLVMSPCLVMYTHGCWLTGHTEGMTQAQDSSERPGHSLCRACLP